MAIKRIIIKGTPLRDEDIAVAAITPGYLVEQVAAGVQKHAGAGLTAQPSFAVEREMTGDGIAVAYATSDTCLLAHCRNGDVVYALLAASAAAVVRGDFMESAGDGTVRKLGTDSSTPDTKRHGVVAVAMEAVDNSSGSSEARIIVRAV